MRFLAFVAASARSSMFLFVTVQIFSFAKHSLAGPYPLSDLTVYSQPKCHDREPSQLPSQIALPHRRAYTSRSLMMPAPLDHVYIFETDWDAVSSIENFSEAGRIVD